MRCEQRFEYKTSVSLFLVCVLEPNALQSSCQESLLEPGAYRLFVRLNFSSFFPSSSVQWGVVNPPKNRK